MIWTIAMIGSHAVLLYVVVGLWRSLHKVADAALKLETERNNFRKGFYKKCNEVVELKKGLQHDGE